MKVFSEDINNFVMGRHMNDTNLATGDLFTNKMHVNLLGAIMLY